MFDYIIVGSGSGGAVLANRLTADSANKVLLLEAGPKDRNFLIHMPAGVAEMIKQPWVNWQFETAPEKSMQNRELYWPRGKTLGGSTAINGMIYIRGNRWDYDHWAELGNEGWSFAECLPYFKRGEGFTGEAGKYHNTDGELGVIPKGTTGMEMFDVYMEAAQQAGHPITDDFNGEQQEGHGWYQQTIRDGRRQSVATCFLKPIQHRSNLTIETDAQVSRIMFEGDTACGVEYIKKGQKHQVKVVKEVLLAAGTCQSPQLLQLSGIGDQEELNQFGIHCISHLPGVGKNLQDHLDVGVQYHATKPVTLFKQLNPFWALLTGIRYLLFRNGLGANNGLETGAFLKTDPSLEVPDIQLHFVNAFMLNHGREEGPGHGFMIHGCQLRPESRGYVGLKSADPLDSPLIQPNYLTEEKDVEVMVKCVRIIRQLFAQAAFDPYRGDEYAPGSDLQSDEEIEQFIREKGETIYHPVGTCKMGTDEMAVVDNHCRVKGVHQLRVVDASVMPTLVGGNTNAPTIMIAEKIADHIMGKPFLPPEQLEPEQVQGGINRGFRPEPGL